MTDPLLDSLASAVAGSPADTELRALYADRLALLGRRDDAIGQAMVVLAQSPGHAGAEAIIARLTEAPSEGNRDVRTEREDGPNPSDPSVSPASATTQAPRVPPHQPHGQGDRGSEPIDWSRLEEEIGNDTKAPFVIEEVTEEGVGVSLAPDDSAPVVVAKEALKLSDVGGLVEVKRRIRETFLDPIDNPEIAKAFRKFLGGGLLLYGPPGCGKTYLARAIAGELGASFISMTLADVLSKWLGESEGNVHKTFVEARQKAPAVLFLDEIDAVGGKRSAHGSQYMRSIVNQLLMEMDGIGSDNDGLFVLAATNMPWDVDPALLRPGRFDRMVLVSPPDDEAREAILRLHLDDRPLEGIELRRLVRATDGFSGADLRHLCETAAEKAMTLSIQSGAVQPISMREMNTALKEVRPSIGPWLDSARNVANYANTDGRYDDLVALLRRSKRL